MDKIIVNITKTATVSENTAKAVLHYMVAPRDTVAYDDDWVIGLTCGFERLIAVKTDLSEVGVNGSMLSSENFWKSTLGAIGMAKSDFLSDTKLGFELGDMNILFDNWPYDDDDDEHVQLYGKWSLGCDVLGIPEPSSESLLSRDELFKLFGGFNEPRCYLENLWWDVKFLPKKEAVDRILEVYERGELMELYRRFGSLRYNAVLITGELKPPVHELPPRKPRRKARVVTDKP